MTATIERVRRSLLLGAVSLIWTSITHATPPSPEMLALSCAGCHGALGASAGPTQPSLATQPKAALLDAMKKFKSDERPSTVMGRLAKGYSDRELEALADYFSKQKPHFTRQVIDPTLAQKGAALHDAHCADCHRENGKAGLGNTPVLASQWLRYLQMQMDLIAAGKRKMPAEMAEKISPLSREDIDALLHFYAGIHQ